ncbi:hypothetical protein AALP_AA3G094600 [Arabis alpina]|uniref:Uncharacterized protein n=1 Tax=Arabis alpina TaxID=50452 RepID=A0A087H833_ARAAL|nr:hypothetical protein AALP_AA3G094600 [Arabis alpina]
MLTHDRDEELSMFLEMRRREKEHRGDSLLTGSDNVSSINGMLRTAAATALAGVSDTMSSQRYPPRRTAAENFLYSENEKSDYDWLLTPPGTPQFEKESHRSVMNQLDAPNSRPTNLKSRLGNCREELVSGNNNKSQMSSFIGSSSSLAGLRRPSSSGSSRSNSRPSTPTRRSTTPTTSTTRPVTTRASTSRSSTPTSRATITAARATTSSAAPRTTTTTTGSSRSATPTRTMTGPSSAPSKKPLSRPATPTRRPSTPTGPSIVSSKAPSRGTSPTVKSSKPWKPPEMAGFSLEAPPNLRTSLQDRPVSASRGRPGVASAPGSRSGSIERGSGPISGGLGHARRQSCSPSRGRAPIGNTNPSLTGVRGRAKASNGGSSCDSLSPVAMGNKMVERVVNMRKLGPPRLNESGGRGTGKSNSAFNSLGYGRNLSKSSIDMALRHMDIRRGMTGNLRPLVTKVPASSMYSVRSRPASVTNSPVATSSSSEPSVDNINILCLDGNEAENDDLLSERSYSSPRNQFSKFQS